MARDMYQTPAQEQKAKPAWWWSLLKSLVIFLFPGIRLLRVNSLLKKSERINPHPWFARQRRRNLLVSTLVSLPLILSIGFGVRTIQTDKLLWQKLNDAQHQLTSWKISKAWETFTLAFTSERRSKITEPSTSERLHMAGKVLSVGILLSFLLGTIVLTNHSILRDTKKLRKILQDIGVFERGDTHRLALATPLGFLIDITGHTGREIRDNERIWMSVNQRVTDWLEDPDQRSLCFFKKAYELKKEYVYLFPEDTKKSRG